jgi:hypothetical protein
VSNALHPSLVSNREPVENWMFAKILSLLWNESCFETDSCCRLNVLSFGFRSTHVSNCSTCVTDYWCVRGSSSISNDRFHGPVSLERILDSQNRVRVHSFSRNENLSHCEGVDCSKVGLAAGHHSECARLGNESRRLAQNGTLESQLVVTISLGSDLGFDVVDPKLSFGEPRLKDHDHHHQRDRRNGDTNGDEHEAS